MADFNKFTKRSIQAVNDCQSVAVEHGNQSIDQEHLLMALLDQDDSLVEKLLEKAGVNTDAFKNDIQGIINRKPKVQGGQNYISTDLNNAFNEAEKAAKQMNDEYVSTEHIFLGIIAKPSRELEQVFRKYGINKETFLSALQGVRGNQRVTSDNPEDTYDSLSKYAQNLVDLARKQKLDPVIGRDSEIRSIIMILSRKTKN
ncbi:MAG: type VI secretion system ATPase TssH, partial [Lachnospiraceae bacterium]|nr:type VI secretion system ATPase TssH [Lachnospiraceae bacterium]